MESAENANEQVKPFRTCNKCGIEKPFDKFSLKKGLHSASRKYFCVTCERQIREAKRYGITLEEYWALLRRPCHICGHKGEMLDADKRGRVTATVCRRCNKVAKLITKDDDQLVMSVYNYIVLKERYPFWLRWTVANPIQEESKPLIDWIENEDRVR